MTQCSLSPGHLYTEAGNMGTVTTLHGAHTPAHLVPAHGALVQSDETLTGLYSSVYVPGACAVHPGQVPPPPGICGTISQCDVSAN